MSIKVHDLSPKNGGQELSRFESGKVLSKNMNNYGLRPREEYFSYIVTRAN